MSVCVCEVLSNGITFNNEFEMDGMRHQNVYSRQHLHIHIIMLTSTFTLELTNR